MFPILFLDTFETSDPLAPPKTNLAATTGVCVTWHSHWCHVGVLMLKVSTIVMLFLDQAHDRQIGLGLCVMVES